MALPLPPPPTADELDALAEVIELLTKIVNRDRPADLDPATTDRLLFGALTLLAFMTERHAEQLNRSAGDIVRELGETIGRYR